MGGSQRMRPAHFFVAAKLGRAFTKTIIHSPPMGANPIGFK